MRGRRRTFSAFVGGRSSGRAPVDDRLHHHVLKSLRNSRFDVCVIDRDELLFAIYPEVSAEGSAPAEAAFRQERVPRRGIVHDARKPQSLPRGRPGSVSGANTESISPTARGLKSRTPFNSPSFASISANCA